jgi:MFS superfamily sulfate permease-like transporter
LVIILGFKRFLPKVPGAIVAERFVVGVGPDGAQTFQEASPGVQSLPGLLVFRYDADLFYADANQFSSDVQALMLAAPDPIRWLVLDCSVIPDVDYSAGMAVDGLIAFVHDKGAVFALAGLDPDLNATLKQEGVLTLLNADHFYPTVADAVAAFGVEPKSSP